jgi:hypothetical protein
MMTVNMMTNPSDERALPKPTVDDLETHFFLYVVRLPNYDFRCRDCDEFTNEFATIPVTAGCEDAYEDFLDHGVDDLLCLRCLMWRMAKYYEVLSEEDGEWILCKVVVLPQEMAERLENELTNQCGGEKK